jgi:hypothetical protein
MRYLNIVDFEGLGESIVESIGDYYEVKPSSRIFSSKLKNMESWRINMAVMALRLMPFRFDGGCRNVFDGINSNINLKKNIERI